MLGLHDLDLKGKTVFLRVDFNVPLDDRQNIRDDTRIKAVLPTLHFLMEREARVIAASHLGRPKGKFIPEFSLKPVADRLSDLIQYPVILAPDVIGPQVDTIKAGLKNGQVLLLENLRFYAAETDNDADFARELAGNVDCYVNDAFGACHRAHASVVGIPALVKKAAAGFLIEKELKFLNRIIHSPEKPYIAILGGAKVSDKIPVIKNLLNKADSLLIGGAMAYTFFSAKGFEVGLSLVEGDKKEKHPVSTPSGSRYRPFHARKRGNPNPEFFSHPPGFYGPGHRSSDYRRILHHHPKSQNDSLERSHGSV